MFPRKEQPDITCCPRSLFQIVGKAAPLGVLCLRVGAFTLFSLDVLPYLVAERDGLYIYERYNDIFVVQCTWAKLQNLQQGMVDQEVFSGTYVF